MQNVEPSVFGGRVMGPEPHCTGLDVAVEIGELQLSWTPKTWRLRGRNQKDSKGTRAEECRRCMRSWAVLGTLIQHLSQLNSLVTWQVCSGLWGQLLRSVRGGGDQSGLNLQSENSAL